MFLPLFLFRSNFKLLAQTYIKHTATPTNYSRHAVKCTMNKRLAQQGSVLRKKKTWHRNCEKGVNTKPELWKRCKHIVGIVKRLSKWHRNLKQPSKWNRNVKKSSTDDLGIVKQLSTWRRNFKQSFNMTSEACLGVAKWQVLLLSLMLLPRNWIRWHVSIPQSTKGKTWA